MISQASSFEGEWNCTIDGQSSLPITIESVLVENNQPALKITPALSLAQNHKGVLVLDSVKSREQKDYFEDDDNPTNGMFNYIRNEDTVKLVNNVLEVTSVETYLRSNVNNGVESPEILQNKDHEVMRFEIQSPKYMEIREYSARGKSAIPKLITVRQCIKN